MAHKVHPKIYRIRRLADWDARGFSKNPAEYLEEDFKIRKFLQEKIGKSGVERVEIERSPGKISVIIHSARPGLIIGRGGEGVEQFKRTLEKKVLKLPEGKKAKDKTKRNQRKEIRIEIREVKNPWTSASLIGQWVAQQIERRVAHRRALKQALAKASANKESKGVKIEISGRLNGSEIARREWLKIGRLPLQTLRADIDYAKCESHCAYGAIGIKVWVYKGEKFE